MMPVPTGRPIGFLTSAGKEKIYYSSMVNMVDMGKTVIWARATNPGNHAYLQYHPYHPY